MRKILMLTHEHMARIKPYFLLAHGIERVDDRRVISGILYVIRNGLQWKEAPEAYGPHKTRYTRFVRGSQMGVFNRIFTELAKRPEGTEQYD